MSSEIDPILLEMLVCPRDHTRLQPAGEHLECTRSHSYPVVQGIPVMLLAEVPQTQHVISRSIREIYFPKPGELAETPVAEGIDPFVQAALALTNGQLYEPVVGKLDRYPIPDTRLPEGNGRLLLDIGCNWGRWTIAASRRGYSAIGIDPNLQAILAARRVAVAENSSALYVVGDARYLPFAAESFDACFSYSVLQHFSEADQLASIMEVARVLRDDGFSMIQMANRAGVRSFYQQLRRGFRTPSDFEVRYSKVGNLARIFSDSIGPTEITPDCYFGLGVQASDRAILPLRYKAVVSASELMKRAAKAIPPISKIADSVYVHSVRQKRASSY